MTEPIVRRRFLRLCSVLPFPWQARAQTSPLSVREFLAKLTYSRGEVDVFLNLRETNWAKFDPVLGYRLQNGVLHDGVDQSRTILSFGNAGELRSTAYAGRSCRI